MGLLPYTCTASNLSIGTDQRTAKGLGLLCRFVMGSNKVLRVALGHGEEDEYKGGLSALADDISGSIGLFFTSLPQDQVPIPLSCSYGRAPGVRTVALVWIAL